MVDFVPKIVAFCCDQSGYPAADMAGALHRSIPATVEIVRVPCAGRIDTHRLVKTLDQGSDGIIVFLCHEENCQFLHGNLRFKGRFSYAQRLIEKIGLEKERLEICSLATNNGPRFSEVLQRKVEQLKKLGPSSRIP